jgi:hypothetical protein
MSKLGAIVLTAAICLPLGAVLANRASADAIVQSIDDPPAGRHFDRAQQALHVASREIAASERADEDVWRDNGSHARPAKESIENATRVVDRAVAWTFTYGEGDRGPMYVRLIDGRFIISPRRAVLVP